MRERNNGIDALRFLAILLIVTSHSVPSSSQFVDYFDSPWYVSLTSASASVQNVFITFINYFGQLGNSLFITTSAYLLCDSKGPKWLKVTGIWIDTEIICVLYFFAFLLTGFNITAHDALNSFAPIAMETYWYISAYLFFYSIHGVLNETIKKLDKHSHFNLVLVFVLLYCILNEFIPVAGDFYFGSGLTSFIMYYVIISFLRTYWNRTGVWLTYFAGGVHLSSVWRDCLDKYCRFKSTFFI